MGFWRESFATEPRSFLVLFAPFLEKRGVRTAPAHRGRGFCRHQVKPVAMPALTASRLPPPVQGMAVERVAMENQDYSARVRAGAGVGGVKYRNFSNLRDGAPCRWRPRFSDLGSRDLQTSSPFPPPVFLQPQLLHQLLHRALISNNPPVRGLSACYDTR